VCVAGDVLSGFLESVVLEAVVADRAEDSRGGKTVLTVGHIVRLHWLQIAVEREAGSVFLERLLHDHELDGQ